MGPRRSSPGKGVNMTCQSVPDVHSLDKGTRGFGGAQKLQVRGLRVTVRVLQQQRKVTVWTRIKVENATLQSYELTLAAVLAARPTSTGKRSCQEQNALETIISWISSGIDPQFDIDAA